jgi:hypothetical protein
MKGLARIRITGLREARPGRWEIAWRSPGMPASAMWYADTLGEALDAIYQLVSGHSRGSEPSRVVIEGRG